MRFFRTFLLGLSLVLVTGQLSAQQWTQCKNKLGWSGGRFYTHWSNASGSCMRMRGANGYSYDYSSTGNTVGGKGWQKGKATQKIGYNCAQFIKQGNGGKLWLTAYGWAQRKSLPWSNKNRVIEYYVIENWQGEWPLTGNGAQKMGSQYTVPGEGTYQAYRAYRYNAPNYFGANRDFVQYFSVRTSKRPLRNSNGQLKNHTLSMREHYKAWNERCMPMGSLDGYLVMAIEGYNCGAKAWVGVWSQGQYGSNWLGNACTKSAGTEGAKSSFVDEINTFNPLASPNPTSDYSTISGLADEPTDIDVYSITGQPITRYQVTPGGGQLDLDLRSQPAGVYLVTITQGKERKVLRISRQ